MSKGRKGRKVKTGGKNILGRRKFSQNEVVPTRRLMSKSIQPTKQPLGNTKKAEVQSNIRHPYKPIMSGSNVAKIAGVER
jgi:hypothetical protein